MWFLPFAYYRYLSRLSASPVLATPLVPSIRFNKFGIFTNSLVNWRILLCLWVFFPRFPHSSPIVFLSALSVTHMLQIIAWEWGNERCDIAKASKFAKALFGSLDFDVILLVRVVVCFMFMRVKHWMCVWVVIYSQLSSMEMHLVRAIGDMNMNHSRLCFSLFFSRYTDYAHIHHRRHHIFYYSHIRRHLSLVSRLLVYQMGENRFLFRS